MKKIICGLFILMVVLLLNEGEKSTVLIPDDAIRFRIIASSNSFEDQEKKMEVRNDLEPILADILSNSSNKEETKNLINYNMNHIKSTIDSHNVDYNINYGINYFPEKNYKGVTYQAGNYESLVVTLGDGLGDNWWCVLFPPLCLLEGSEEDYDEYTYSFFIKDIIDKYF